MTGAKRSAHDDRYFWHHGIGHGIHHLGPGFDNAAPLGVTAHHETVYVMQENQRHKVLVAIHDETRGLFGAFGIDHAAKFNALFARRGISLLRRRGLVGHDAHGKSPDTRQPTDHGLAVLGLVLVELRAVNNACDDLLHVIRTHAVGFKDAVDF